MKTTLNKIFLLLAVVLVSCSSETKHKGQYYFVEIVNVTTFDCFPIWYDSVQYFLCAESGTFYEMSNIKFSNRDLFDQQCLSAIEKDEHICVDSALFTYFMRENMLVNPLTTHSEWQQYDDIHTVCDTIRTLYKRHQWNEPLFAYLIYRCWQHDIHAHTTDEGAYDDLCLYDSRNSIEIE